MPGDSNNVCDNNHDGVFVENCADIFVRDRDTDGDGVFDEVGAVSTAMVSVDSGGDPGNDNS